jgi:2-iminobutanoate/2-iminopropanoate deaminase
MRSKSKIKHINTQKAPKALGPYSQGIIFDKFIFCSGQIGINPKTGDLEKDIQSQTKQAIMNLKAILEAGGSSLEKVIKTTVYLKNISDFQLMNEIYGKFFNKNKPTRATIEVSNLPKGALIEIEAIAIK